MSTTVYNCDSNYTNCDLFDCRHLGSFYNDSEKFGGKTSSPISHGFDHMNATVEVAPTATTNCECNAEWQPNCNYGHYGKMTHCGGKQGPDPDSKPGCCFNVSIVFGFFLPNQEKKTKS